MSSKLKEIREKRHISQRKLADSIGISIRTISRYENGYFNPTLCMVKSLAKALHVRMIDLCDDYDKEEPPL